MCSSPSTPVQPGTPATSDWSEHMSNSSASWATTDTSASSSSEPELLFPFPRQLRKRAGDLTSQYLATCTALYSQEEDPNNLLQAASLMAFISSGNLEEQPDDREILHWCFKEFSDVFLCGSSIYCAAAKLPKSLRSALLRDYFITRSKLSPSTQTEPRSALFRLAQRGQAKIFTQFGGQGTPDHVFEDIRHLYQTYHSLVSPFIQIAAETLLELSQRPEAARVLRDHRIDILHWLEMPSVVPEPPVLSAAPINFPLVGLLQLLEYVVTTKTLGLTPSEMRSCISGTTGHSQGIIVATITAIVDDWESFHNWSALALRLLFWIGLRSQQAAESYDRPTQHQIHNSAMNKEGHPSFMLSIRGLALDVIEHEITKVNSNLRQEAQVQVALINDYKGNVVVGGPPASLCGLANRIRAISVESGTNQSKVVFSSRKPECTMVFLPISAPFHTNILKHITNTVLQDLGQAMIDPESLKIPVYHTNTGANLMEEKSDLIPELVKMIAEQMVDWPRAVTFESATHVVVFGPGGVSGSGMLTAHIKEGQGVRVILADRLEGNNHGVGYQPDLYRTVESPELFSRSWSDEFSPKVALVRCMSMLDTRFSRLLNLPPLMVAGMTPTTAHPDFVAAVMKAGYHAELAGGGFHSPEAMKKAVIDLSQSIPQGRAITINMIYANPRTFSWQLDLIASLKDQGLPIDGITIGAGVPSSEATERILALGLRHTSFKPGTAAAIESVLGIARSHPEAQIIIQWTGGRAGGHHSTEDFHQPLLSTYSRIRSHDNVTLVVGSGFGAKRGACSVPYLTGSWSTGYGYPPMPVDGILLGSRVMTSRQAHTSPMAKDTIFVSNGFADDKWEQSYKGKGDILTVISEMGEPIHMIATRGVRLWADLDARIFSKPKAQQLGLLQREKESLVKRLNQDFQKVWFGKNERGNAVDLEEMTYAEVVSRLAELLFVERQGIPQWIDPSYSRLFADFILSVKERFSASASAIGTNADNPRAVARDLIISCPEMKTCLLQTCDIDHFLYLCQREGTKPVVFIPTLDDNFQTYFKKDSLWQSEDLEAVVDSDADRVCILHGPVAVRHSRVEEDVGEILDDISQGHLEAFCGSRISDNSQPPTLEYLDIQASNPSSSFSVYDTCLYDTGNHRSVVKFSNSQSTLLDKDHYLLFFQGQTASWKKAVFTANTVVFGNKWQPNPLRQILAPGSGQSVEIMSSSDKECVLITHEYHSDGQSDVRQIELWFDELSKGLQILLPHQSVNGTLANLCLRFRYQPDIGGPGLISGVMHDQTECVKQFYWALWFGDQPYEKSADPKKEVHVPLITVDSDRLWMFKKQLGDWDPQSFSSYSDESSPNVPIEYSFILAWEVIMKPLFFLDMNLFFLVHLGNSFEMKAGTRPLQAGDAISCKANLTKLMNQPSGVLAEVSTSIQRSGEDVIQIVSQFLYRGLHIKDSESFQIVLEPSRVVALDTPQQVAILRSKSWFIPTSPSTDLLGVSATFDVQEDIKGHAAHYSGTVSCHGVMIGNIHEVVDSRHQSKVISYLERHGKMLNPVVPLETPIAVHPEMKSSLIITSPKSNNSYAKLSGDMNPIHTNPIFAAYASLPMPITHGMNTASAVRRVFEDAITRNGRASKSSIVSYDVTFSAMVLPSQKISVSVKHTAMSQGMKIFAIEARSVTENKLVLTAKSTVMPELQAYVFTGQGSQRVGMGMGLKGSSPAAAKIWKQADDFFMWNYGFYISYIVEKNPSSMTVSFAGSKGRRVLRNYLAILERAAISKLSSSTVKSCSLYQALYTSPPPRSYTFTAPESLGLLSSTQFTQPAVTITELAQMADLRSRGIVSSDNNNGLSFAGHSLGEYAALAALGGDFMPVEKLSAITFERGMTMQIAVERDASGRSPFSMCAVNPSKVPNFNSISLVKLVESIYSNTNWLLEIVNYNIEGLQYICAGDVRALACLTECLNRIAANTSPDKLPLSEFIEPTVIESITVVQAMSDPSSYKRGPATVPLRLIDVPFHSKHLVKGIESCREFLRRQLNEEDLQVDTLVGHWIPNVTGRPFGIEKSDFEHMYQVTESETLRRILANWTSKETCTS